MCFNLLNAYCTLTNFWLSVWLVSFLVVSVL